MIPTDTPAGTPIVHHHRGGPDTSGITTSEPALDAARMWTVHVTLDDGRHIHCVIDALDLAQLELFQ